MKMTCDKSMITCYKQDEYSMMENQGVLDWRFECCLRTLVQSGKDVCTSIFCYEIVATKMILDHL